MALTKAEISESLITSLAINKRDAKEIVEQLFEEIKHALEKGDSVKISGFGKFELRDKKERPGRNPKTGQDVPISARRVVTFKPGQKLKDRTEGYQGVPESDAGSE
ncbi:MAG: integration host factor subunit alpha [Candidatus Berkiellales bacterium]